MRIGFQYSSSSIAQANPAIARVATWTMPSSTCSHTSQCVHMTISIHRLMQKRESVSTTSPLPLPPRSNHSLKPNQVMYKWSSVLWPISLSQQPSMQARKPSSTIRAALLLTKIALTTITTQSFLLVMELTSKVWTTGLWRTVGDLTGVMMATLILLSIQMALAFAESRKKPHGSLLCEQETQRSIERRY